MDNSIIIPAIGFLAQGFFSARTLVQWMLSERARHVLSPALFWALSIAGSYLLCLYGWLRDDFAIVFGQLITYYIYLWNLNIKGVWLKLPRLLRAILILTPIVAIGFVACHAGTFVASFFRNDNVPLWLLIFGTAGQLLFSLRFVYQWLYSHRKGESRLPAGFWNISLAGAIAIVTYGILRHDIVLIVGQSFGMTAYIRNLVLIKNEQKLMRS